MSRTVQTVCSCDCPDTCSVLVDIEGAGPGARATRFRGDPRHPFTRGFLCGKVGRYERIVHSPDRLLTPRRRAGPKGSGRFRAVSWEQAIEEIAARIRSTVDAGGGEALLQYHYAGTIGLVQRFSGEALFHRLGATRLRANICFWGADAGYAAVVGNGYGVDPEDVASSDLILAWGANFVTTGVHLAPLVDQARRAGGRLVVIDPYRNRTARRSDEWIAIRPGTDAALALGMMRVIDAEGRLDREFIERRTLGYERLRREVLGDYPPRRVEEITSVPAARVVELARRFARARAPLIKAGIGLGRNARGGSAMRAVCCLAGCVGAWKSRGGGVLYDTGCAFGLRTEALTRPDWLERPTREIYMSDLGPALCGELPGPPIRFLWVHGSNPLASAPRQEAVRRGLAREDLFTVVHERFLTDTARHADLVLPAVTFVEASDLYRSYGHLWLQYGRQAMAPLGECRSNLETFQRVGKALGFDDPWFERSVEDFARELIDSDAPQLAGIDPDRLLDGEPFRLRVPRGRSGFAERFATASGKLEFFSAELEAAGAPPLARQPADPFAELAERYPLRLVTPPAHAFLHGSLAADPLSRRREGGEPRLLIHPRDAGDLQSGEVVELSGEEGSVELPALVSDEVCPGVVVVEGVWWPSHCRGGRGINELAPTRRSDIGEGAVFHDIPVAVRRALRRPEPPLASSPSAG